MLHVLDLEAVCFSETLVITFQTHGAESYLLNPMELSFSWNSNRFTTHQEITCIVWRPKIHNLVHKVPLLFPVLSWISPVHAIPTELFKIHLSIIILSTSGLQSTQVFPPIPFTNPHPQKCYMPHPSHSSWYDHLDNTGEQNRSWSASLRCRLLSTVLSFPLRPKIFLVTLF
jgi:hypothetical protein